MTPASSERAVGFERVSAVERTGCHGVDVLTHVELVDGVVAVLEAILAKNSLGGVEVGRPRRRQQFCTFQVGNGVGLEAVAHDELLHLPDLGLAVETDVHRHAGLLHIGIQPLKRNQNRRHFDLSGHHRRDIRRPTHQLGHVGLDVLLLEEATLQRDEIGQR